MGAEESKVESIFYAAMGIESTAERAAYLDGACAGDPDLRSRIELLLDAQPKLGQFLENGGGTAAPTITQPAIEQPGTLIGPYKLLEQIGEGGMGVVYMARQQEPVKRNVALKVIKPGMDSKQVIARFEAERQALAMMDHPNIAHVLDGGATESGRPYFVMELVQGIPVTEYCDQVNLTTRQRLALFVSVCQAVQHAHQKGIIHRDVKPSNVLVTLHDGVPVPKIIDFGIAKAVHQQLTEKSLFTGHGQMMGTPMYMSPEQAEMSSPDVDTRSDIYSLGVLLYELLTGNTPFDRERLREAGFDEVRRVIREEEPPRPSHRFSTLDAEALSTISGHRGVNALRLGRLLRGDLDWIVMKALQKDRTRRYESASALAADVERHLAHEPIQARPPTLSDRAAKWARRHRPVVWSAAALLVVCTVGSLVSTLLIAWERLKTERAYEEKKEQLIATQKAEQSARDRTEEAIRQRDVADRNLYVAHMRLAKQDWETGQISRLHEMLDSHIPEGGRPDLRGWEWYYLLSLCHSDLMTLRGHYDMVNSVAWSPDGSRVASGSSDHTAKIWDAATGQKILTLRGHQDAVSSVAWSPDSSRLATGSCDRTVKIWDADTGKELFAFGGFRELHFPQVSVAWRPDGQRLAAADRYGASTVKVWDTTTGKEVLDLEGRGARVAWSPDGKRLATCTGFMGEEVRVFDAVTGQEILCFPMNSKGITAMAWSPDGTRVATAGYVDESGVQVWDADTGHEVLKLELQAVVRAVAWSYDSKRLAAVCEDQTIRVWNMATGEEILVLRGHRGTIRSVAWSPDALRLASAGEDHTVKLWDARRNQGPQAICLDGFLAFDWSPRGDRIASAHGKNIKIWNVTTSEELHTLEIPADDVAWSPDGDRLAASKGAGQDTVILSLPTQSVVLTLPTDSWAVSWSPDGKRLALIRSDKESAEVWDTATGKRLFVRRGTTFNIAWSPVQHPERRRLASCGGGDVTIWDAETGEDLLTLRGHVPASNVYAVAWSPDGRRLASGGSDQTIKLWDTTTGRRLLSLVGHTHSIMHLGWSGDGKRLASAGADHVVKIWDPSTGQELFSLPGRCLCWSLDGHRLATSDGSGSPIRIWDASPGYALASSAGREEEFREMRAVAALCKGNSYRNENELDKAIEGYTEAIRLSPKLAAAYVGRGCAYSDKDESDEAIEDFTEAIRIDPACARSYEKRGEAHAAEGHYDLASSDLAKSVKLNPHRVSAWCWCALAQLGAGRRDEYRKTSAELLHRFGRIEDPENAESTAWTCTLAPGPACGQSRAVTLAQRVAAGDPKAFFGLTVLGAVLYRAGRLEMAIQHLTEADRLLGAPNESPPFMAAYAWFFLAMAHQGLGQHDEAQKWFGKAAAWTDNVTQKHRDGMGLALSWNQRLTLELLRQEAKGVLKTQAGPPNSSAWYHRGLIHAENGDLSKAVAAYDKAIRLEPGTAQYHLSRGEARASEGDLERALPDFDEAIRLDPKNAEAWVNRGSIYFDKGEADKAEADLREAFRIDPLCGQDFFQRGEAYRVGKQQDRAIAAYRKAVWLDPQYTEAYVLCRRFSRADQGSLDQAIGDFRQMIRLRPEVSSAWLHWASCWLPAILRGTEGHSGVVFVSDMPWVRSTCGWGRPDAARNARPFGRTLAGLPYSNGVGTHAFGDERPADVVLDIPGPQSTAFKAHAGLLDRGSVRFQVLVDEKLKHETPLMYYGTVQVICVGIQGGKQIVLRVLNGGDGAKCDSVAWGYARFVEAGRDDPLEEPPPQLQSATDAKAALLLAAIHARLRQELARRWFDKAVEWMGKHQAEAETLRRFRMEAQELLGIKATLSTAKEPPGKP